MSAHEAADHCRLARQDAPRAALYTLCSQGLSDLAQCGEMIGRQKDELSRGLHATLLQEAGDELRFIFGQ